MLLLLIKFQTSRIFILLKALNETKIFSHFQDYLIQYISHQYQDLLYCNSSQYILSTYTSQHNNNNNNNNVVLAMTMPYSGQGCRHIVIANTTLLYK